MLEGELGSVTVHCTGNRQRGPAERSCRRLWGAGGPHPPVYTKWSDPRAPHIEGSVRTALSLRPDLCADGLVGFGTLAQSFGALLRIVSRRAVAALTARNLGRFRADLGGGVAVPVPRFRHAPRSAAHGGILARAAILPPGLIRGPQRASRPLRDGYFCCQRTRREF